MQLLLLLLFNTPSAQNPLTHCSRKTLCLTFFTVVYSCQLYGMCNLITALTSCQLCKQASCFSSYTGIKLVIVNFILSHLPTFKISLDPVMFHDFP